MLTDIASFLSLSLSLLCPLLLISLDSWKREQHPSPFISLYLLGSCPSKTVIAAISNLKIYLTSFPSSLNIFSHIIPTINKRFYCEAVLQTRTLQHFEKWKKKIIWGHITRGRIYSGRHVSEYIFLITIFSSLVVVQTICGWMPYIPSLGLAMR